MSTSWRPYSADKLVKAIGVPPSGTLFTQLQTCGVTHACHGHPVPSLVKEDWQQILDVVRGHQKGGVLLRRS